MVAGNTLLPAHSLCFLSKVNSIENLFSCNTNTVKLKIKFICKQTVISSLSPRAVNRRKSRQHVFLDGLRDASDMRIGKFISRVFVEKEKNTHTPSIGYGYVARNSLKKSVLQSLCHTDCTTEATKKRI